MITKISNGVYNSLQPLPDLHSLAEFKLTVEGVGGHKVPYAGYTQSAFYVNLYLAVIGPSG